METRVLCRFSFVCVSCDGYGDAGGRDRQPVFQAGNGALTNRSSKRREDFTRQRYYGLCLSLCFWLSCFSP